MPQREALENETVCTEVKEHQGATRMNEEAIVEINLPALVIPVDTR